MGIRNAHRALRALQHLPCPPFCASCGAPSAQALRALTTAAAREEPAPGWARLLAGSAVAGLLVGSAAAWAGGPGQAHCEAEQRASAGQTQVRELVFSFACASGCQPLRLGRQPSASARRAAVYCLMHTQPVPALCADCCAPVDGTWGAAQKPAAGVREIDREEVAKHRSRDSVWVTYKDGVYDVTDFAAMHPGGAARLMLAAGGAIDPFWAMYAQHQTAEVRQLLEGYRIGTLVRRRTARRPRACVPVV